MKNQDEDILIIGGGIVGVCSAYYLLKAGRKVTLLEQTDLSNGCSFGNAGIIVPSHSIPLPEPGVVKQAVKWMFNPKSPFYIKPRLDFTLLSWLWKFRSNCNEKTMLNHLSVLATLTQASLSLYDELIETEDLDCDYNHLGSLYLFKTNHGFEDGLKEASLMEEYGITSKQLNPEESRNLDPNISPQIAGAIYFKNDANINPDQFVQGLSKRCQEQGGIIRTATKVLGFEISDDRISTVYTNNRNYHPKQVILAAGSWSQTIVEDLQINIHVQPAKGYSVTFKHPPINLKYPLLLSEAKIGVNPMGPLLRFAGTFELSGFNFNIDQRRVNSILDAPKSYLTGNHRYLPENIWCGLRPVTPDGLPIIGPASHVTNLILATGHAMIGVTLGPITGKIVSEIACGTNHIIDPSPLHLNRFG